MSEPLKTYTVSNGKAIEIRRVSIFTLDAAVKDLPQPKPPMQIVEGVEEANYAHPSFTEALTQWEDDKRNRRVDAIYACGVKCEIDKDELAEFRAVAEAAGFSVPANDTLCYIKHCVLTTIEDAMNVQTLIMEGSLPSEEVIGEAAENFKSDVEEPAHPEDVGAIVGGDGRES